MADSPEPLEWSYDSEEPEAQRTHPAYELIDAIRADRPIEIEWAVINGDVDLGKVDCSHGLTIRNTVFTGHVNLAEARFGRSVDLTACEFQYDVNFRGTRVDGQLSLAEAKIAEGILESDGENFAGLEVTGSLVAFALESEVGLCFARAEIGGSAEFDGLKVEGDFDLELASVAGHLSCHSRMGRRTEIVGRVSLAHASVGGDVRFDGAKIGWETEAKVRRPAAFSLECARVGGHVTCGPTHDHWVEVLGRVSLDGATVGGSVSFGGAKIGREVDPVHNFPVPGRLSLENAAIGGDIRCQAVRNRRTEILGSLSLLGAAIGGRVVLDGLRIGPEARSKYEQDPVPGRLDLQDAEIRGSVSCRAVGASRAEIVGEVCLLRARVGGDVAFQGAKIGQEARGLEVPAILGRLNLDDARITGDVFCDTHGVESLGYSFRVEILGSVSLWGTAVAGDVFFDGVKIGRQGQFDVSAMPGELNLRDASIVGDLFCRTVQSRSAQHRFRAEIFGPVSLVGASIDGEVRFMGAAIGIDEAAERPPGVPMLNLRSAEITGGLFCGPQGTDVTEVHGDVCTLAANILCVVDLDRVAIDGDLDMERTRINGPLLCASDETRLEEHPHAASTRVEGHFRVSGKMTLTGMQAQDVVIDGRLFGAGAHVGGLVGLLVRPIDCLLRVLMFLLRLFIGQREPSEEEARLRLDRAQFSKLHFKVAIPDKIHADGVAVCDLELPGRPFEYTQFLRQTLPFRKSTYLALEALLLNKGLDAQARRVYVAMANRDLILGRNLLDRWLRWLLLGVPLAYGARPSRLFWGILIAFVVTVLLFKAPGSLVSYPPNLPNEPVVLTTDEAGPDWDVTIHAALGYHFPMLHFLGGNPHYAASNAPIPEIPKYLGITRPAITYRIYALFVSTLSWVIVPLWLAGLTGIVRRRR